MQICLQMSELLGEVASAKIPLRMAMPLAASCDLEKLMLAHAFNQNQLHQLCPIFKTFGMKAGSSVQSDQEHFLFVYLFVCLFVWRIVVKFSKAH